LAFPLVAGLVWGSAQPLVPNRTVTDQPASAGNTVLVFLPQNLFASSEYEQITRSLAAGGVYVRIAAADSVVCVGTNRILVAPDTRLADIRAEDYAGLVLVGGPGQTLCWDDSLLHAKLREFAASARVVAAIGTGPITMARAGILTGRRATVAPEPTAVRFIRDKGARYSFKPLVADGRLVTAARPEQARDLGRLVARLVRNTAADR
jgi:protease I